NRRHRNNLPDAAALLRPAPGGFPFARLATGQGLRWEQGLRWDKACDAGEVLTLPWCRRCRVQPPPLAILARSPAAAFPSADARPALRTSGESKYNVETR